jgi:membrane protein implicated in regulation of membrane protease activity
MNRKRRTRLIFGITMGLITFFLIWPGYTLFSHAEPLVLGFPLSFAWVIFCTLVGFAALLGLYLSDHHQKKEE